MYKLTYIETHINGQSANVDRIKELHNYVPVTKIHGSSTFKSS